MAFLLAVESGSAGPLFGTALAAGAIVVLDFVSMWLLKKLRSAARKVGRKLKGLAQKFKNRRKGKKKRKKDKKDKDSRDPKKKSKEEREKEKVKERVDKAKRELPPKVQKLLAKRPSQIRLRAQLAVWCVQYRMRSLELRGNGAQREIVGRINPELDLGNGWVVEDTVLFDIVDKIADTWLNDAQALPPAPITAAGEVDLTQTVGAPAAPAANLKGPRTVYKAGETAASDTASGVQVGFTIDNHPFFPSQIKGHSDDRKGGSLYPEISAKLGNRNDAGSLLGKMIRKEPLPSDLTPEQRLALGELYGL